MLCACSINEFVHLSTVVAYCEEMERRINVAKQKRLIETAKM